MPSNSVTYPSKCSFIDAVTKIGLCFALLVFKTFVDSEVCDNRAMISIFVR